MTSLKAENLKKVFNRRIIFEKINFEVTNKDGLGITGKNGSGKSTMVKIISGLFEPSGGKITYSIDDRKINPEDIYKHIGFVSPYLNLYDEFSALENLILLDKIRNVKNNPEKYLNILKKVNLFDRKDEQIRVFSSGMKQRLKFAFAVVNEPDVLILDEPSTNLDTDGIEMMNSIMQEHRLNDKLLIIATNDLADLKFCNLIIDLNKVKND